MTTPIIGRSRRKSGTRYFSIDAQDGDLVENLRRSVRILNQHIRELLARRAAKAGKPAKKLRKPAKKRRVWPTHAEILDVARNYRSDNVEFFPPNPAKVAAAFSKPKKIRCKSRR